MKIHPNDDVLEELVLSLDEGRRSILRHLTWCDYCRAKLYYLPRPLPVHPRDTIGNPKTESYETSLAESRRALSEWEAVLEKERDDAPGLFVELFEQPAEERDLLLRDSPRFQTWGVFELLVERSLEASIQDPAFGEHLGKLALRLSDHLDRGRYGAERIADLRARAWAFVGNACRLRSDFQGAEEAFGRAYQQLKKGTLDGLERAIFLDLKASLRRDQRRFEEALRLLQRAEELFLSFGERHRAGRSLVNKSIVYNQMGDPERAVVTLRRAVELIDPEKDPRLLLCARHNLVDYTAGLGRFLEAQRLYREARPLYRSFNEPWVQNRRKWVRGKIAKGLGQLHRAETQFLAARDGFIAEGIPYDTALVSLELALLYAEQGRTEDLKRLAAEMVPIFASRHIHREALAALTFFRQAVEAERAGAELVAKVAAYLRRAEGDPALPFESESGAA
ncbi:MAG TPA: tetratricopeptide repeat protein [Thermoanaerobaculia bacterium]|nr:tetratricopeptide repeat protein [Thermoanaerobaculia bacterium]